MLRVVYSTNDKASINIRKHLQKNDSFQIVKTNNSLNYSGTDAELIIFVSKHASKKNIPSLTCHTPGNYGGAEFGGEDGVLSVSNAKIQTKCLRLLNELNNRNQWRFCVTFEVTHHGPSLPVPCLFVEVGSSAKQWNHEPYCSGIAAVTTELLNEYRNIMESEQLIAIGVGGSHYAHSFTSSVLNNNKLSIGHICPDYALKHLNKQLLAQMIEKTVPEPKLVLISKNVNSSMRKNVIKWCGELNMDFKRLK